MIQRRDKYRKGFIQHYRQKVIDAEDQDRLLRTRPNAASIPAAVAETIAAGVIIAIIVIGILCLIIPEPRSIVWDLLWNLKSAVAP
jgi:hypothetical protein